MKKVFFLKHLLIFLLTLLIMINIPFLYATPPMPISYAEETIFSGIIPSESTLILKNNQISIDLLGENELEVFDRVERSAIISLNYEIQNPSEAKQVRFVLPFISTLKYLPRPIDLKVNNQPLENKLLFSGDDMFLSAYYNYREYLLNLNMETFNEVMNRDYSFQNDIDGYLYTIKNPKTRGIDYSPNTKLIYKNVPNGTVFVDAQSSYNGDNYHNFQTTGHLYESEEVDYFFASKDFDVEAITTEFKKSKDAYVGYGVLLEPALITKEPIKLSEYLQMKDFYQKYNGPYLLEYYSLLFKEFDKAIESNQPIQFLYSSSLSYLFINNFQQFALEFDLSFEANETKTIDITFLSPIFCYKKDFSIEYIPTPINHWQDVEKITMIVISDEELISSSLTYDKVEHSYSVSITEIPNEPLTITLNNRFYQLYGCGCRNFFSKIHLFYLTLMTILLILFRRNKFF